MFKITNLTYPTLICLLFCISFSSQSQTFQSTHEQTHLIELYSSQGCSSCPPAERWVSSLQHKQGLWDKYVPVVFHVDYWDYLGWKDPFSNSEFSQRQRNYKQQRLINSVYTPGFIVNGSEWRGWYKRQPIAKHTQKAGTLTAKLNDNMLSANYSHTKPLKLYVALLGSGLKTAVASGENSGRSFTEDFIVLDLITKTSATGNWQMTLKDIKDFNAERYALAIWVSTTDSLSPLQATGGWLENAVLK